MTNYNLFYQIVDGRWWHVKHGSTKDIILHNEKNFKREQHKVLILRESVQVAIDGRVANPHHINPFAIAQEFHNFYRKYAQCRK